MVDMKPAEVCAFSLLIFDNFQLVMPIKRFVKLVFFTVSIKNSVEELSTNCIELFFLKKIIYPKFNLVTAYF